MTIQEKIGRAIIRLRRHLGLSQEQFAYDSDLDRRYLSDVENGKRNISISVIERISNSFGINPSTLLYEAEQEGTELISISEVKKYLYERGDKDSVLLEDPCFTQAIIGISEQGRIVYSYDKMIDSLKLSHSMSYEEAVGFIDHITSCALPHMGNKCPIILYNIKKN